MAATKQIHLPSPKIVNQKVNEVANFGPDLFLQKRHWKWIQTSATKWHSHKAFLTLKTSNLKPSLSSMISLAKYFPIRTEPTRVKNFAMLHCKVSLLVIQISTRLRFFRGKHSIIVQNITRKILFKGKHSSLFINLVSEILKK
jgi:hypothetical protein